MATQGNWGGSWDGEWFGATEATDFRSAALTGQGSVTATATALGSMSANLAGQSDLAGLISVTDTGLVANITGSGSLQATISHTGEAIGNPGGGGGSGGGRVSPSDWSAARRARLADDEAAQEMIKKLFAQAQEEDQVVMAILETMMEDM